MSFGPFSIWTIAILVFIAFILLIIFSKLDGKRQQRRPSKPHSPQNPRNESYSRDESLKSGTAPRKKLLRYYISVPLPPEGDFTAIDIETTGLDACTCDIIEIGAIRYRANSEVATYHTFIRPDGNLTREAYAVNHIRWSDVAQAPDIDSEFPNFLSFIGRDTLVGYNISFDIKFLQTRSGQEISNHAFDVLSFAREALLLDNYKLTTLKAHFKIHRKDHNAIDDCRSTVEVMEKLLSSDSSSEAIRSRKEIQRQNEEMRMQEEARKAEWDAAVAEKKRLKAEGPSLKDLYSASKLMTGKEHDYTSKVYKILRDSGIDTSEIRRSSALDDVDSMRIGNRSFFGVKCEGRLRYIFINLPLSEVHCDFLCSPSSMGEGYNATRIFVPSPDDLDEIKDYIISAYKCSQ